MSTDPTPLWHASPALLVGLLLALTVFTGNEWAYQRAQDSFSRLRGNDTASQAVQLVLRRLVDAESSQRGYLMTERKDYLAPGVDAQRDIERALSNLHQQYRANSQLLPYVDGLASRTDEKLAELDATLALHDRGRQAAAHELMLTDIGREKMQAVRVAATTLLTQANSLATTERAKVLRTLDAGRLGVHAAMMLSLLWFVYFLRKSAALQDEQRNHARDLQREGARLETEVRARTHELSGLNDRLQLVREEERQHLARTLHDELGAILTAAKFDLARMRRLLGTPPSAQALARLDHLASMLDQGIGLKRRIMEELMPSALHNLGLPEALQALADGFSTRTGIAVELALANVQAGERSRVIAYRWVEGALTQIARRGLVKVVRIDLGTSAADFLQVCVRDDVADADTASPILRGDGMVNLQHRIEGMGGSVTVLSHQGPGTALVATLPRHD